MNYTKIITIVCMILFFLILVTMQKQPTNKAQPAPQYVVHQETKNEIKVVHTVSQQPTEKSKQERGLNFFSALGQLLALTLSCITSFIAETVSYVLS